MSAEIRDYKNYLYQVEMGMTVQVAPTVDDHRNVALAFEAGWDAALVWARAKLKAEM